MDQDQAKHYLKAYRVEKGGLVTTDSSITPVLYYLLSVVKVDTLTFDHLPTLGPLCIIHIGAHQVWQQATTTIKFVLSFTL